MQLSNQDLSQIDEDELLNLPEEELHHLSIKLLNDLKDAREHLSQNSHNSSRPPSSEAPWDTPPIDLSNDQAQEEVDNSTKDSAKSQPPAKKNQHQPEDANKINQDIRKPGKQPSAQGFGRTQKLVITDYQNHYPETCDCCHQTLESHHAIAYAVYETIDIDWADVNHSGILVTNTKHTFYEITGTNGHITRKEVNCSSHAQLLDITRTEWRLVGPRLTVMIICLATRTSREHIPDIKEFLYDWKAIFQVLDQPHQPLTNHEAKRALRHWHYFAWHLLWHVIRKWYARVCYFDQRLETCCKRNQSP